MDQKQIKALEKALTKLSNELEKVLGMIAKLSDVQ